MRKRVVDIRVILCYNPVILIGVLLAANIGSDKSLVRSFRSEGWRMVKS